MKTLNDYLDLPYHFTVVRSVDDAGEAAWVASVDELPGCISQGDTIEEATTMIRDAMAGWIETGLRHGDHIPEPRDPESYRLCLGYAGWGPGQLEREMVAGGWLNSGISSKRIFDTPVEKIWEAVIRDLGIEPAFLVQGGGKQ